MMNILMRSACLLCLIWLLLCGSAFAEEQVQIFPLKHRLAQELLEKIQPLLQEDERASAAENHLVVIASPQTIEAVGKLVEVLDKVKQDYLVQVRWVDDLTHTGRLGYDAGTATTQLPAGGSALGTRHRQSGQQVRVTEGEEAYIVTGEDIPYSSQWAAWSGRYSTGYSNKVGFQKIRSGFVLQVQPVGTGQLQVQLRPQLMQAGSGSMLNPAKVSLDRMSTTLQTEPGRWIDVGAKLPDSSTGLQILAGEDSPLPSGRKIQLRIDAQK